MTRFEFNEESSELADAILMTLPALSQAERLRLASSILIATADRNGSDGMGGMKMVVETDEHRYTIRVSREELSEQE